MEFEKLKKIIAEVLNVDPDEITMETTFQDDLGADSLDVYQIIMGIEEEFDIEIPAETAEQVTTVACKPESTPAAAGMPVAMSTTAVIKRRCMPEWATGNGKETAVVSPIGPIRMLRVIRSLSSIRLPTMTAMADKLSSVPA